ncbi:DUF4231 domain-containing protein [Micromonospora zhanjiangensis]|uniref:DUF4231 domain-containing protein n=2 Tax=Micromonospora zhanjiangensis TaxID=1522057 RepID=A0ABV8KKV1_9ACTN
MGSSTYPGSERRSTWMSSIRGPGDVEVPGFVVNEWRWYSARARRSRLSYQLMELASVLGAACVPTAVALGASGLVTALLGGGLVFIAGVRHTFDWHRNWIRFARVSRQIEREVARFGAGLEPYDDQGPGAPRLVSVINEIVRVDIEEWETWHRSRASQAANGGTDTRYLSSPG